MLKYVVKFDNGSLFRTIQPDLLVLEDVGE